MFDDEEPLTAAVAGGTTALEAATAAVELFDFKRVFLSAVILLLLVDNWTFGTTTAVG